MAEAIVVLIYLQLALAALSILALLFRIISLGRFRPYIGASIAALAYLLVPVLLLVGTDYSYVIGTYFLGAIATPMLWFTVFDSIWAASSEKKGKKRMGFDFSPTLFGYFWTLVMVLCAVGVCATIGSFYTDSSYTFSATATQGVIYFQAYGLWGYVFFAFLQLISDTSDFRHFSSSLYMYIFLLIVANIGVTIDASSASDYYGPSLERVIASLILSRYFGLFAIGILIFCGHNWRSNQNQSKTSDGNRDLEENGEQPS
ncbi:hypothetical protein BJV82DRAFT_598797, partial [Fennellomyces sp. T-0311]